MAENPLLSDCNIEPLRLDQQKVSIQATLLQLNQCQREIDEMAKNEIEEILKTIFPVEKHNSGLKQPLFQRRNDLLNKIPNFWSTIIYNAAKTVNVFTDEEIECFKFVSGFSVQQFEDSENSKTRLNVDISFKETNPFFENGTVSKTVFWDDNNERVSTCTPIIWKEENNFDSCSKTQFESFFDWLNEDHFSVKFMHILEIWENPLQYYTLSLKSGANTQFPYLDSKQVFEEVNNCQKEINELNKKLDLEMHKALNGCGGCSNNPNYRLYEKRNAIIEQIPDFWVSVFRSHPYLSSLLGEEEINCLKYLKKIDLYPSLDTNSLNPNMTVYLHFSEDNPYMNNSVLSKTFYRDENLKPCSHVTPILWKENNTLRNKMENGSLFDKKCGDTSNCDTNRPMFFDWFSGETDTTLSQLITLAILQIWEDPLEFYQESIHTDHGSVSETMTELRDSTIDATYYNQ